LKYQLCILKHDDARDWGGGQQRFRFTVVNLDKAKDYPLNFVCILPMRLNSNFKSSFEQRFGDESLKIAKKLLTDALRSEADEGVRDEIGRRLKLLDPESITEKRCASCGKTFQVDSKKKWRKNFCEDCAKKKFGYRSS